LKRLGLPSENERKVSAIKEFAGLTSFLAMLEYSHSLVIGKGEDSSCSSCFVEKVKPRQTNVASASVALQNDFVQGVFLHDWSKNRVGLFRSVVRRNRVLARWAFYCPFPSYLRKVNGVELCLLQYSFSPLTIMNRLKILSKCFAEQCSISGKSG